MKLRLALIGALVSAAFRGCGAPAPIVRAEADAFRDSVGVNVHLGYDATPYASSAETLAALRLLGVARVRDSALREGDRTLPRFVALGRGGAKFDLFVNRSMDDQLARVEQLLAQAPGALASLEGPNEANHEPFDKDSSSGRRLAQAYQARLYADVRARPRLAGVPIFNLTYWPPLSGLADAANFHAYPAPRQTITGALSWQRRLAAAVQPRDSLIVCTETGFTTAGTQAVTEQRQAELETILLLENFRAGVSQTFLYELFDEQGGTASAQSDREGRWGLFRHDGSPKPAALALRRLMQVLAPAPTTLRGGGSPLAVSGPRVRRLRLRRRDGVHVTLVWRSDAGVRDGAVAVATVGDSAQMIELASGQTRRLIAGRNSVLLGASPIAFIEASAAMRT